MQSLRLSLRTGRTARSVPDLQGKKGTLREILIAGARQDLGQRRQADQRVRARASSEGERISAAPWSFSMSAAMRLSEDPAPAACTRSTSSSNIALSVNLRRKGKSCLNTR